MNNKMGYILIAIGLAIVVWGIVLLTKQKTIEKPITTLEKSKQTKVKPVDFDSFIHSINATGLYWLMINVPPKVNG
jgi:hypothetical protein